MLAIAIFFWSATAGATEQMTLLDAAGNRVGPVVAIDSSTATVPVLLYGERVLLQFSSAGTLIAPGPRVVYHSTDCSGHGYLFAFYATEQFFSNYAVTDGSVVWIADPKAVAKTMDVHSSGSPASCVSGLKLRESVLQAVSVDIATRFRFPVRVIVDTPLVDISE